MRFRDAKPYDARDMAAAYRMFRAMLVELHEQGSPIVPSQKNRIRYMNLYERYTSTDEGVVVFVEDGEELLAVAMAGKVDQLLERKWPREAIGFGAYVLPEHRGRGIASQLWRYMAKRLRDLRFDTYVGNHHDAHSSSEKLLSRIGFRMTSHEMVLELREG